MGLAAATTGLTGSEALAAGGLTASVGLAAATTGLTGSEALAAGGLTASVGLAAATTILTVPATLASNVSVAALKSSFLFESVTLIWVLSFLFIVFISLNSFCDIVIK